ncbi:ribosomal protein S6 kinase [Elysia marginata]|uniref:Ribosomal protein S6 kinase n=1 Tax=Elysia marginata TaxID=1093978 RepID=A0AAV4IQX9_9GAST|nr:ribosomal protein S6 kinase [Elysia marginata]
MAGVFDLELTEDGGRAEELSDEEYFEADETGRQQGTAKIAAVDPLISRALRQITAVPRSISSPAMPLAVDQSAMKWPADE